MIYLNKLKFYNHFTYTSLCKIRSITISVRLTGGPGKKLGENVTKNINIIPQEHSGISSTPLNHLKPFSSSSLSTPNQTLTHVPHPNFPVTAKYSYQAAPQPIGKFNSSVPEHLKSLNEKPLSELVTESLLHTINSQSDGIIKSKFLEQLEKDNIIYYPNQQQAKLTVEGRQYFQAIAPKIKLKEEEKLLPSEEHMIQDNSLENTIEDPQFVAVIIKESAMSHETLVLTNTQTHICNGQLNPETDSVLISSILTSDKGTKSGIAQIVTTIKIADQQPVSGKKIGQYVASITPNIEIPAESYQIHAEATLFINQSGVREKLQAIADHSSKFESIPYTGDGISLETLLDIYEVKKNIEDNNNVNNETNLE